MDELEELEEWKVQKESEEQYLFRRQLVEDWVSIVELYLDEGEWVVESYYDGFEGRGRSFDDKQDAFVEVLRLCEQEDSQQVWSWDDIPWERTDSYEWKYGVGSFRASMTVKGDTCDVEILFDSETVLSDSEVIVPDGLKSLRVSMEKISRFREAEYDLSSLQDWQHSDDGYRKVWKKDTARAEILLEQSIGYGLTLACKLDSTKRIKSSKSQSGRLENYIERVDEYARMYNIEA